jgi:hypothetical protein
MSQCLWDEGRQHVSTVSEKVLCMFGGGQVLAEAGAAGLPTAEIAKRIQRAGLRDLRTSKTPEVALLLCIFSCSSCTQPMLCRQAPCVWRASLALSCMQHSGFPLDLQKRPSDISGSTSVLRDCERVLLCPGLGGGCAVAGHCLWALRAGDLRAELAHVR